MSSKIDPAKLKVVDLRNELSARGLDVKGTKPILVKRLKEALENELDEEIADTSILDTSTEEVEEDLTPKNTLLEEAKEEERVKESAPSPEKEIPDEGKSEKINEPVATLEPTPVPEIETTPAPAEVPVPEVKPTPVPEESKPLGKSPEKQEAPVESSDAPTIEDNGAEEQQVSNKSENLPTSMEANSESIDEATPEQENGEQEDKIDAQDDTSKTAEEKDAYDQQKGGKRKRSSDSPDRSHKRPRTPIKEDEPEINAEAVQLSWYDSDLYLQVDKSSFLSAKPINDGAFGYVWAGARATHGISTGKVCYEMKITEKLKWDDWQQQPDHRDNRYRSDRRGRRDYYDRDDKRNTDNIKSDSEKPKEEPKETDNVSENKDEEIPCEKKEKDQTEAEAVEPMETTESEAIEKKDDDKQDEKDVQNEEDDKNEQDEKNVQEDKNEQDDKNEKEDKKAETPEEEFVPIPTHFIRLGWSAAWTSLQLGEDDKSYGYDSSGKIVKNKEFSDYGITFDVGDVIGAFLDINDSSITLQFTVNGQIQPTIEVPRDDLPDDLALFPHVLSRNYALELNFGEQDEPWCAVPSELSDYTFISKVEEKVAGPTRPENRSDCEVLLMCGLPASGKSEWVKNHIATDEEKHYTVLGVSNLFDRMTVFGEPMKSKFKGKWSTLVDRISKILNRLVFMAAQRRRNYIIDQTNVFPSAQRRKMRPFEGFKRKAIVLVNEDEEQARRQALQETLEGKEVRDSTLLDMKATMAIPEAGDWLEEVLYVGVDEEKAKKIIKDYNTEGQSAGYGHEKRYKRDWWNQNKSRNNYRSGRNYQRPRSGGYNRQYGQSSWVQSRQGGGGGGGGGGWKDQRTREWRGNDYNRRDRDYYSQSGYGGGGGGGRYQSSNRSQGGGGQRWGGNGGGGSWGGGWNQQSFGRQNWNNQGGSGGGQGNWSGGKYGSSGSGYGSWSYYGQQQQHWSGQGQQQQQQQSHSGYAMNTQSQGQTQGQYSQGYSTQEAWAQYAKQYAQHQQMAQNQPAADTTQNK